MREWTRLAAYVAGRFTDGAGGDTGEFPVCIDAGRYAAKPDGPEVGRISIRIASCAFHATACEIARAASEGRTILPGVCKGKRDRGHWKMQRLFFVDVDNEESRGYAPLGEWDAVFRAYQYGLPIVMSYQTFSGTDRAADPEGQRFRLVFAAPETIADRARAEAFASGLLAAYPEADQSSDQLERMFYGTDTEVSVWA